MPCEELDIVWKNIKAEARALAECEPMLASFYHATLLKHENLGSALSYMLANKLASPIMPAIAIREVVEEAYAADPEMIASAACDIQAVRTRDPAVVRPTVSVTGCGIRGVRRWRSFCKIRCPLPSRLTFIRRQKLAVGLCSITPPALWSVKPR